MKKKIFVTAIGTDSGKTLISALLCEALGADYWKPVQAGSPTDHDTVKSLVSNPNTQFFPSTYSLKMPASPHAAAKAENLTLKTADFEIPKTENSLVIEGAGGLLVPLNDQEFVIDLAEKWQKEGLEIVLVANLYLGSINHTLLSIRELESRKLKVKGLIFNGQTNEATMKIIAQHSPFPVLFHLPFLEKIDQEILRFWAKKLDKSIF